MPAGGTVSRIRSTVTRRILVGRGTAGLAVLLLAGGLAACGTASGAGGSAGSITLYSGQHEQTTQSLVTAFEQQTGIQVNVRYNDEDSFADEIIAEKSHPVADVFYTENSPVLEYLQDQGLLAPVDSSTRAKTDSTYNSPQGDWVGVSARVSVLIYNPSLISESQLPTATPRRPPGWMASRRTPDRTPTRTTRRSRTRLTGARWPSAWSTSTTGTG
jgi:iron(III) transport system substrate-binding protein